MSLGAWGELGSWKELGGRGGIRVMEGITGERANLGWGNRETELVGMGHSGPLLSGRCSYEVMP